MTGRRAVSRAAAELLGDIQGNILRGYGRSLPRVDYLFAAVDAGPRARPRARRLLSQWTPDVADGRPWRGAPPRERLGLAFTHPGLEALGVPTGPFASFADFREGMRDRAVEQLGDAGDSDPAGWMPELTDRADVLVTVYAADEASLDRAVTARLEEMSRAGLRLVLRQRAAVEPDAREPFGFRDGFSQPIVALPGRSGPGAVHVRGEGAQRPLWEALLPRPAGPRELWRAVRGDPRPLRLGEFLLGHLDEDGVVAGADEAGEVAPALVNGTFMVWRKLEQDVAAFNAWLDTQRTDAADGEALAAWAVGRRRDGRSLMEGGADRSDPGGDRVPDNSFLYGDDPAGRLCPAGAHVRRAHPRDALGARTERSRRNRIIRRGVPYRDADTGARGLVFVAFNASLHRQFEQIQGHWLARGDAFGLGAEPDFLTGGMGGRSDVTMLVPAAPGRPARVMRRDRPFVRVRGGYYLFVPGRRALREMFG